MNRWNLTEEVKQKYTPVVKEFLESLKVPSEELREKDFSDTELNPYTLWELLESLGYEKGRSIRKWLGNGILDSIY